MDIDTGDHLLYLTSEDNPRAWRYLHRREMQEILPGVYLGPYSAAASSKLEVLLQNGITHILCIRQSLEARFVRPCFPDKFRYLTLEVADTVDENIIQHFPKAKAFIDDCLKNNGKCLVHDNAGISRSAAFMIAYVMERYDLDFNDAFKYVQKRRFCIGPNDGFIRQLKEYRPIIMARSCISNNGYQQHEMNEFDAPRNNFYQGKRKLSTDEDMCYD